MLDIIVAYTMLASGIVANKFLLKSISPDLFVGIRMFVSGVLLFAFSVGSSHRLRWRYVREDIGVILFISLCTTLIPSTLKAFALDYMPASKYSLLGSIDPFVTAIYAYFLWNERLTLTKIMGMLIGFSGVLISIMSSMPAEQQWGQLLYLSYPEIAVIGSVIVSRYGWILVQGMLKKDRYMPVEINSLAMLFSGSFALCGALLRGAQVTIASPFIPQFIGIFLITIVIGNLIGYTMYSYCLKRHNATLMSLSGFMIPCFVYLFSQMLGFEKFSLNFIISLALLFCGVCIFYIDDLKGRGKNNPA